MMKSSLFDLWKEKIPKYSARYKTLMDQYSGGAANQHGGVGGSKEGDRGINLGISFPTNYEFYIYAFFLGLYSGEKLDKDGPRQDFSVPIKNWGKKTNISTRADFSPLQNNIFMALIAKSEIDFIALEKGEIDSEDVIKTMLKNMMEYTNGGFQLIKEKIEDDKNYFIQSQSGFLDFITEKR